MDCNISNSQLCRICLILNYKTVPLVTPCENETSYLDMYLSVTHLETLKFPDQFQICLECAKDLVHSYEFKQKCLNSNDTFEHVQLYEDKSIQNDFEEIIKVLNENGTIEEEIDLEREILIIVESDVSDIEEKNIEPDVASKEKKINISSQMLEEEIERVRKLKQNCSYVCKFCDLTLGSTTALANHVTVLHREFREVYCTHCNEIFTDIEDMESHKASHKSAEVTCKFCGKLMKATSYLGHLETHLVDKPHKCKYCKRSFARFQYLKSHVRIHLNMRPFKCPNCTGAFVDKKVLENHVKRHGMFKCGKCSMRFVYHKQLKKHKCSDAKQKIEEYKGKNADNMKEVQHIDIVEARKIFGDRVVLKNFCDLCNQRVRDIVSHTELVHQNKTCKTEDLSKFNCHKCGKTYESYKKFKCHLWIHQSTGHICTVCKKKFKSPAHLRIHERTHSKERPHTCKICKKSFSQSGTLKYHELQHGERKEACQLCDKKFCRKADLKLHMEKHEGKRPHLCPECGKSFYQKCHLTCHYKTHQEERPFSCKFCGKSYKSKSVLNSHLKIHIGGKQLTCTECSYKCFTKYRLEQHMRKHGKTISKKDSVHACLICKMTFPYLSFLKLHMTSAHEVIS